MSFAGPSPPSQPPAYEPPQYGQQRVYASALAQLTSYTPPTPPAEALPALPVSTRNGHFISLWLFGFLGFLLLALIGYFGWALGPFASAVGLVLALIPLAIVFLGFRLIDGWEPEPKSLVFFAIAWGAIAAVGLTLLTDLALIMLFGPRPEGVVAVVQAPIVEELWKGAAVFIMFLAARRAFDGPIVVYGALVGAGFAFTQYFAISLIDGGGEQLTVTFVVRALLSPFAHAMFTSLTGFAIGPSARRPVAMSSSARRSAPACPGFSALSCCTASGTDMRGSRTSSRSTSLCRSRCSLVSSSGSSPSVAKRRLTRARLGEYAVAGCFTPEEVTMLATLAGRKAGMDWASWLRGDRRPLMCEFVKDTTELVALDQRAITGRDLLPAEDERALLIRTRAARAVLLAF